MKPFLQELMLLNTSLLTKLSSFSEWQKIDQRNSQIINADICLAIYLLFLLCHHLLEESSLCRNNYLFLFFSFSLFPFSILRCGVGSRLGKSQRTETYEISGCGSEHFLCELWSMLTGELGVGSRVYTNFSSHDLALATFFDTTFTKFVHNFAKPKMLILQNFWPEKKIDNLSKWFLIK
jgi:hypothetical protein